MRIELKEIERESVNTCVTVERWTFVLIVVVVAVCVVVVVACSREAASC